MCVVLFLQFNWFVCFFFSPNCLQWFHRSMASFHDSSQSRMMSHRLSNVPSEISRFSQLMSPPTVKQFATWDRVDGSTPVPTVSRISFNCVLKGFALGASLLPSLRAEYKVSKQTVSYLKGNCHKDFSLLWAKLESGTTTDGLGSNFLPQQ